MRKITKKQSNDRNRQRQEGPVLKASNDERSYNYEGRKTFPPGYHNLTLTMSRMEPRISRLRQLTRIIGPERGFQPSKFR